MNQKELITTIEDARDAQAKELDLKGQGITKLPKEIGWLANLEDLNLQGNDLELLPEQIGQLDNLRKLDLGENRLIRLPTQIGRLANLQSEQQDDLLSQAALFRGQLGLLVPGSVELEHERQIVTGVLRQQVCARVSPPLRLTKEQDRVMVNPASGSDSTGAYVR